MAAPPFSPFVPLAISIAGFGVSAASFGFTAFRAHQERLSKASKLKYEYSKDIQPRMSFFTTYKRDCMQNRKKSYTDAFIEHTHDDDKIAEGNRGVLGGWWGTVIEDHTQGLLPADFL